MTSLQHAIGMIRHHLDSGNFREAFGQRLSSGSTEEIIGDLQLVLSAASESEKMRCALSWLIANRPQVHRFRGMYHCGESSALTPLRAVLAEYEREKG